MFCYQCGTKLIEGMQFCPACGTRVVNEGTAAESLNASQSVKNDMLAISILGEAVHFDSSIEFYVELRKIFEKLGQDLAEEFSDHFYSKYKDMDVFVCNFPKDFQEMFKEATDAMNELLSTMEIFGVTQDELEPYAEKYCYHTYLEVQEIMEQYQQIVGHQQGMKEYRQARKDSRGRLVGGGFGLKGAAKGIATAGAVNMATGALYSIGNAIGNVGSAISAANAKDKLLKSGIVSYLEHAIRDDILGVHLMAVDIIAARKGVSLCKFTEEDKKRANKIWNDLEQELISADSERAATIQMLTTYPFNSNYYRTAIKLFPNEVEQLREFTDFFGFDIDEFYGAMRARADLAVEILWEYKDEFENLLVDDLDYDEEHIGPLTTNITDMMEYFDDIFGWANEEGFSFLPSESDKGRIKLRGAKSTYAQYGNETPLMIYDATLGKSGKDGFLVTNKYVYIRNTSGTIKLPLCDAIEDIHQERDASNNCNYLYFGEYRVHLLYSGDMVNEDVLGDFVELVIALILFLTVLRPADKDLWEAIVQYQRLPPPRKKPMDTPCTKIPKGAESAPEVCYCFECGAENDVGDKFCCECGAELI